VSTNDLLAETCTVARGRGRIVAPPITRIELDDVPARLAEHAGVSQLPELAYLIQRRLGGRTHLRASVLVGGDELPQLGNVAVYHRPVTGAEIAFGALKGSSTHPAR
jgi:hypothetical protein